MHILRQICRHRRLPNQMKMVGHQAIRQNIYRKSFLRPCHQVEKFQVIVCISKNQPLLIPTIQYMINKAIDYFSACSRHIIIPFGAEEKLGTVPNYNPVSLPTVFNR